MEIVSCTTPPATPWSDELIEMYRNHYDQLCRSARRIVRCPETSRDVVQEAIIRYQQAAWRPTPGSELAYLRSIVVNTARSRMRRVAVEERHRPTVLPLAPSSEQVCLRGLSTDDILALVAALPERQRQVVVFRLVLGFSEREVADLLGVSLGSVKTHCARARAALRAQLELPAA